VLDPFAGSGTTLLAADRLGVNAIGIEQSAEYVADIHRRLAEDAPLFAEPVATKQDDSQLSLLGDAA
jgi:DNA modification methylase